ncbi:CU044_5270 family protein [Amycolatopsis sp. NPDC003861]
MDDLQILRDALRPVEPAQEAADRSRHRLRNHMLAAPARRRVRPLVIGAGLVAAAAAAAVVVATLPGAPDPDPTPPPQAVAPVVTGTEVLLAAATVAEKAPDATGKYWHIKTDSGKQSYEYWYTTDGHLWFRGGKSGGRVVPLKPVSPLQLAGGDVTFEQLRTLPTDPAALRDWLVNAIAHSGARTSAGPLTAADRERELLLSTVSLVSTLPAPPAVRAAAFRLIAAYPGVKDLGPVPGGRGFLLPGDYRLVVDPATGRINRTSMFVSADGAINVVADPQGAQVRSEWTDSLPE